MILANLACLSAPRCILRRVKGGKGDYGQFAGRHPWKETRHCRGDHLVRASSPSQTVALRAISFMHEQRGRTAPTPSPTNLPCILTEPGLHRHQIVGLLGYTQQSALNRSCRRWFGKTPRQCRARGLAERRWSLTSRSMKIVAAARECWHGVGVVPTSASAVSDVEIPYPSPSFEDLREVQPTFCLRREPAARFSAANRGKARGLRPSLSPQARRDRDTRADGRRPRRFGTPRTRLCRRSSTASGPSIGRPTCGCWRAAGPISETGLPHM